MAGYTALIVLGARPVFPRLLIAAALLVVPIARALAADEPAPHFAIGEFRVLGNTVLEPIDIERAVYPFLGPDRSFADVEQARAAVEAAYRAHDYGTVFVDIPEQDVSDGVVRLKVTEGRLRVARIEGAKYFSQNKLLAQIPAAKAGTIPKLGELQREIGEVNNQSADRSVVPVLKAGPVPGTVDLALKVDDHLPLHGGVELDNQYTVGTTRLRASVNIDYANLFNELDDLSLMYQTSPQKTSQVGVYVATYTTRPFAGGIKGSLTYVHSSSDVPTVGALGVLGKGNIFSGRITIPVAFSAETTQSVFVGADYKDFSQVIVIDPQTESSTPIPYLNFTAGFSGVWRAPTRTWLLTSSVNLGVRGLVNSAETFENKRYLASPNYFYLRDDASVTQTLPANFALRLRLAGQYTLDPLITNENFAIAGADGVRGYLESEVLGDSALKGTLQLDTPTWQPAGWFGGKLFAFYDAGGIHTLSPLAGQPSHVFLKSVGGGLDLVGFSALTGSLTWAHALANGSSEGTISAPAYITRQGESRLLFTVRGSF